MAKAVSSFPAQPTHLSLSHSVAGAVSIIRFLKTPRNINTSFLVAIDPRDIAFLPVDNNDPTGDCFSGISSGQIGGANEWLVGDVFLKNAYFSTDVTDNTLSLANLV